MLVLRENEKDFTKILLKIRQNYMSRAISGNNIQSLPDLQQQVLRHREMSLPQNRP